jgi:hypothetical protein
MLATLLPPLRPLKGWLVASQYRHQAGEGRLILPEPDREAIADRPSADAPHH